MRPSFLFRLAWVAVLVGACGAAASTSRSSGSATVPTASPSTLGTSQVTTLPPSGTASLPAGVTIYYAVQNQVELSAGGPRVLVDVADPSSLSRPATADDILLITHAHPDHFDPGFYKSFPGKKVLMKAEHFSQGGITVTGIAAAHNEGDPITADGSTDYIYLVEIGGMRIVHFGDLGQNRLSAEQLDTIGKVDVAFSQLNNPISEVDEVNRKGFNQMAQVQPRVFIPTHLFASSATAELAMKTWPATYTEKTSITLTLGQLPAKTAVLFMADNSIFGKSLKMPLSDWSPS